MTLSWKHVTLLGVLGVAAIGATAWLLRPFILAYGWALLLVGALLLGQGIDYARARIRRARIIEVQGYPIDVRQLQDVSYTTVLRQIHPQPQAVSVVTSPTIALPPPPSYATPIAPVDDWQATVQDPTQTPAMLILGPMNSGKSTLMEAFARTRTDQLIVIQPNRQSHEWHGLAVAECDDDGGYTAISQALAAIRAEFARRGGVMKHGDVGPWLTVVWDELPLCMYVLGDEARGVMVSLLSAGRPRRMRLLGGSTSERVEALGLKGFGDLFKGTAVVRLGAFAVDACPETEHDRYPTTLEALGRKARPVERGPVLSWAQTAIDPARVWRAEVPAPIAPTPPSPARMTQPEQILAWLQSNTGQHTAEAISQGTGIAVEVIRNRVKDLSDTGEIQKHGTPKNYTYEAYSHTHTH